jgi:SSS family solute:Na+ symporter
MLGLLVGVPLFIMKEVTGIWASLGLPEIHYTIMSTIMMFLGIALHVGISLATRQPVGEDTKNLVWNRSEAKEIFTTLKRPLWTDRTLWSLLLTLCTAGFIIWWW